MKTASVGNNVPCIPFWVQVYIIIMCHICLVSEQL